MSVTAAVLVLTWIALAVLALALAGTLRQLRDVQAALVQARGGSPGRPWSAPPQLCPGPGVAVSIVLLVDESCPSCTGVAQEFARLAGEMAPPATDPPSATGPPPAAFHLVAGAGPQRWRHLAGPSLAVHADSSMYRQLDTGWRPALTLLDGDGARLATEPAGSVEAVRALVPELTGSPGEHTGGTTGTGTEARSHR